MMFIGIMTGSLVVALIVTWLAWQIWIPERAFHCTDDGLSLGCWTSAHIHEAAGDKILPGWTWDKLGVVNNIYEVTFLALWIGGGVTAFRISRAIARDYVSTLSPNTNV